MNRRELLTGLLALPAAGALTACTRKHDDETSKKITTLRIILQGPFAVVLEKNGGRRIKAFVPYDEGEKHEFYLQSPLEQMARPSTACRVGYQFELPDDGLEASRHVPYVDRGFDDVNLTVNGWTPSLKDYFVYLDLPVPQVISYIPPLEPAQFEPGGHHSMGGDFGRAPVNHVLEYRVRDVEDVRMRQTRVDRCGEEVQSKRLDNLAPVGCGELYSKYSKYWSDAPRGTTNQQSLERQRLEREFASCSFSTYFFGVGLPKDTSEKFQMEHGVDFYNLKLLPAIYQRNPIPPDTRVVALGKHAVPPCDEERHPGSKEGMSPAVWQDQMPGARLRNVLRADHCLSLAPVVMNQP